VDKPQDKPRLFWDAYRTRWEAKLEQWYDFCRRERLIEGSRPRNQAWTERIYQAADQACLDFAAQLQTTVEIGRNANCPIDVYARNLGDETQHPYHYLVAFESEQKSYPGKGNWHKEFKDLCGTNAELRVLAGVFKEGEGPGFRARLEQMLRDMRSFWRGPQGDFCLIFGPEWTKDEFPWLILSLEQDFSLRDVPSEPFIPRQVMNRNKPCER
jgi:hypothetical protein